MKYYYSNRTHWKIIKNSKDYCELCKYHYLKYTTNRLVVDHNHHTDEIRGLICDLCNNALGQLESKKGTLTRRMRKKLGCSEADLKKYLKVRGSYKYYNQYNLQKITDKKLKDFKPMIVCNL